MATDLRNDDDLGLLGVGLYVVAAVTALLSCFFLFHAVFGWSMLLFPSDFGDAARNPPISFGLLFATVGTCPLLTGWTTAALIALAGRRLRSRTHSTFCFFVCAFATILFPLGTIVGGLSIWRLTRPETRASFTS